MKLYQKFTYVNMFKCAVTFCIILSIGMMINVYRCEKYINDKTMRMEELDTYREQIRKELKQLKLDYAMSSKRIVSWVSSHVVMIEPVDFNKEYSKEELNLIDATNYVAFFWDNYMDWNLERCGIEVDWFVSSYGNLFLEDEEFMTLMREREELYRIIMNLETELDASYEEDFVLN